MKAILSIYLKKKLHFHEDKATVIYHTFSMFCYFTPIFGSIIADQLLGKFKTIVYISIIYVLGHLLKTLAAIPTLGIPLVHFSDRPGPDCNRNRRNKAVRLSLWW